MINNIIFESIKIKVTEVIRFNSPYKLCSNLSFSNIRCNAELSDFEVVHGTSRIVLLIPDKLYTTIVLAKEGLRDCGKLIDLVTNLISTYLGLIKPQSMLKNHCEGNEKNFKECLETLQSQLIDYKGQLESELWAEAEELGAEIIRFCDEIRIVCQAYLLVAHPVFIMRDPDNLEAVETIRDKAESKLREVGSDHLMREYQKLKQGEQ